MNKKSIIVIGISLLMFGTFYVSQNVALAADPSIIIKKTSIASGGNFYEPQTGPTVHKGENATIIVGLLNSLNTSISLIPKIKVYRTDAAGAPFYSTTTAAFRISANSKAVFSFELPLFDDNLAVYAGTIVFVDAAGTPRSLVTDFQYAVGGVTVTIQSVDISSGSVKSGKTANVFVVYSGSMNVGSTTVAVRLFNEKETQVGQNIIPIDIVEGTKTKIVPVVVSADSNSLRADVAIAKNGQTLSSFSTKFVSASSLSSKIVQSVGGKVVLVVILAIILVLVVWFAYKKYKKFR